MGSKIIQATILILLASSVWAQDQGKGYTINGTVRGVRAEGKKVYLIDKPYDKARWKESDSTIIKNERFVFKGKLKYPQLYYIFIENDNPNPKRKGLDIEGRLAHRFYLENSNITYTAHYDSLPTYYGEEDKRRTVTVDAVIKGSKSDSIYSQLNSLLEKIRGEKEWMRARYNFALQHPESEVAVDQSVSVLGAKFLFTTEEIDLLDNRIGKVWRGTELIKPFEEAVAKAKRIAIGQPYSDFDVYDTKGVKQKISRHIPPKYTILEFWASWCGPCRGKIPHLKEIAKKYAGKLEIISIAIEEPSNETWKRAMAAEKMPWEQFLVKGKNVMKTPVGQIYPLYSIPWSLLVDPQGRIVGANMTDKEFDDFFEKHIK